MGQYDANSIEYAKLTDQLESLNKIVRTINETITTIAPVMLESKSEPIEHELISGPKPDAALGNFARKIYLARRDREKNFQTPELFHDPAWDILLDIFIAHSQDKYISVMDATLSGHVPSTTALRWVWGLEKSGIIMRVPDGSDKRRKFVVLTDFGLKHMRRAIRAIGDRMSPPLYGN